MAKRIVIISVSVVALGLAVLLSYGYTRYLSLEDAAVATRENLASTSSKLASTEAYVETLEASLAVEQAKNGTFANQISTIKSTVGTLDKLARTDKELLAKYSKVYFLSEHYTPEELATIDTQYVHPEDKELFLHAKVVPSLEALVEEAHHDDIDLRVTSAFRSFAAQGALKSGYKVVYGKGANAFSADQGYSEHQLGTTVDFTTVTTGGALVGFEKTPAYTWLTRNAHKFGFVLSYPKGNAYYQYEPWHWRYVGEKLATRLYQDEDYFYELEQREIDTYLIYLFDE
jgi:LAS superfamily LD-carboxypeptidase LdcB